tara:strand:+ start:461 stop:685 length:225 start_codon:yes stop_codon:yes gene_type:complete
MTVEETNWLLSLPKENKLMFIESALKEGDFGIAMGIAKILLDAPITKGGVSTEEISEVMDKGIAEMPNKNKKNV